MADVTGEAALSGTGSLIVSGGETIPLSLQDLMGWFFDVDITASRSFNDALYQSLVEAYAADATFDDLIALIP